MKYIIYAFLILQIIILQGCGEKTATLSDAAYNKQQTIMRVNKVIEQHKYDKLHSALALSISQDNHYSIGYAYDATSDQSATKIAMQHCQDRNRQVALKRPCQIYLLNNQTIRVLR